MAQGAKRGQDGVAILDYKVGTNIYKTNTYRMPLFEIVGVTSTKMTYSVAFASFLSSPSEKVPSERSLRNFVPSVIFSLWNFVPSVLLSLRLSLSFILFYLFCFHILKKMQKILG